MKISRLLYSGAALAALLLQQSIAFAQTDADVYQKADALLKQMTLQEKVSLIHGSSSFTSGGVPRLGIPEWVMSDGPHGVRLEHGRTYADSMGIADASTYLPTGVCLAATWNPKLGYAFGSVLGSEAAYRGKDVILGPGINIIRSPLNGRNFEYQSEDPYLVSRMAVGYIKGVQDQGVAACVKHYAVNNIETKRTSINVELSERALREIYLSGFKAAVQEGGVYTLMGSYNKVRGEWATHNNYLMNQILKKEWGFKGAVISDWGAVHNTQQALWNGTDVEMGTDLSLGKVPDYRKYFLGDTVVALVKSGKTPEYIIDDKVRRILYVMLKTHVIDKQRKKGSFNTKEHQQTARKIAEEGIVLLKNQNNILPLTSKVKSIAVIGFNANRPQGLGGGSSQIKAFYEVTALEGLKRQAAKGVKITYAQGYKIERGAQADAAMIKQAADAASKAEVAVIVGGWTHGYDYNVWADNAYDAEDTDKPNMNMPFGQDELIKAVLKANPKTIVVLIGGGPIDMTQWAQNTPGIIQAWYPGMEGGNALAGIIYGKINPSGKLPMSFPKTLAEAPDHVLGDFPNSKDSNTVYYNDDIYVGYRYFDTYKVEPQFAFGHGLSYTQFAYSGMQVQAANGKATVTFTVTNTGKTAGAEVAQVYVHQEKSLLPRPQKELKAFDKVFLQPGEKKQVTLILNQDAFQYFNDVTNNWVMEKGNYDILVGGASNSINLTGTATL
ncbi:glycoside hydrolase family 3 C-terminal domain-containing protein [Mucilaginibacter galii]|uniref:Glycosyl hydrolase n=1 Tax=Mucilaginibacter galii TaxID=2005073 RepID=A0A917N0N6_9SPHI|nr:glycoside hydrolase family 3 C-terminal domain-containing protein [Mucilaginibacter galii]GGI50001.1 glycosyl hydrolase [Mucilaginibacter galii]